jgi:hypothetical protein
VIEPSALHHLLELGQQVVREPVREHLVEVGDQRTDPRMLGEADQQGPHDDGGALLFRRLHPLSRVIGNELREDTLSLPERQPAAWKFHRGLRIFSARRHFSPHTASHP